MHTKGTKGMTGYGVYTGVNDPITALSMEKGWIGKAFCLDFIYTAYIFRVNLSLCTKQYSKRYYILFFTVFFFDVTSWFLFDSQTPLHMLNLVELLVRDGARLLQLQIVTGHGALGLADWCCHIVNSTSSRPGFRLQP